MWSPSQTLRVELQVDTMAHVIQQLNAHLWVEQLQEHAPLPLVCAASLASLAGVAAAPTIPTQSSPLIQPARILILALTNSARQTQMFAS